MSSPDTPALRANRKRWLALAVALFSCVVVFLFTKWKTASDNGGQRPATPFNIAGNLYYVGTQDVTSFLITSPQGHILIDGGYPGTPPMIIASIRQLGFDIRDVRILLNSHSHFDHAGGLAELQRASGAELWVSEGDADVVASGMRSDPMLGPLKILAWIGVITYPRPRVDHRFENGAKITLGGSELTAVVTGGHTRGATTWLIPVRDGGRTLLAADVCDLNVFGLHSLVPPETYPGIRADFERGFETLKKLPVDIFLTNHARAFGRYRKFAARDTAKNPVDPFIDRPGYLAMVAESEKDYRVELAYQLAHPSAIGRFLRLHF